MQIYTVQQMQALEKASDAAGHSYAAMMEAAGSALAQAIETWVEQNRHGAKRILVLAGPGNNGGDGLIAACELSKRGYSAVAYLWKRDEQDPLVTEARRHNVSLVHAKSDAGDLLTRALERAEIIIDALLGTGLKRQIEGDAARILAALKARRSTGAPNAPLHWIHFHRTSPLHPIPALVAVDLPSGLHADDGTLDEATVPADLTVTFAGPKLGMLTPEAANVLGELVIAEIGIPEGVITKAESTAHILMPQEVASFLPDRPRIGHKGTFGTTMIVGGSINYIGAPALCAIAAGRTGAGLVQLAVPSAIQPLLAPRMDLTTATWLLLPHDMGVVRADAAKLLLESLGRATSIVLGPGLGTEKPTQLFVWSLFGLDAPSESRTTIGFAPRSREIEAVARTTPELPPMVIDADGLNILAKWDGEWWHNLPHKLVLTPHPAEMGRLLGRETTEIQQDRLSTAREASARFKQVVILKGANTIIAAPDGRAHIASFANDALGKAGSGDVLAGIIGALLAQGVPSYNAACLGVVAHGLAGEKLRREQGGRGALASDLLDVLPEVWTQLEQLKQSSP